MRSHRRSATSPTRSRRATLAGTPEENWSRAEQEVLRRDIAARALIEVGRDDGWSELDDEEHAALEAVHARTSSDFSLN